MTIGRRDVYISNNWRCTYETDWLEVDLQSPAKSWMERKAQTSQKSQQ
jgi:hypothetical protein